MYLPVLGRALLVVAALPATSVGGNPLGNRFSGIVFGVALRLLVAAFARVAHAMRVRASQGPTFGAARGPWRSHGEDDEAQPEYMPAFASHAQGIALEHRAQGRHEPTGASTFAPSA